MVNVVDGIEQATQLIDRKFGVVFPVRRINEPLVNIQVARPTLRLHAVNECLEAFGSGNLTNTTNAEIIVGKDGVDLLDIAAFQLFPDGLLVIGPHLFAALLDLLGNLPRLIVEEPVQDLLLLGL